MKKLIKIILLACMTTIIMVCAVCKDIKIGKTPYQEASTLDFAPIHDKIQSWISKGYYSDAGIIVVHNYSTIYENYFGNYIKETSTFIAASGKWLAAATVDSVVETTNLSWNDKVSKWLPEFTDVKGEATLRQLFLHTSQDMPTVSGILIKSNK